MKDGDIKKQINKIVNETNRSDWPLIKFDKIAFNISERVEPKDTDAEVYIGLEHIDPDSIHIRRTGVPSDVEGTKLKVYKGDVIFGKRRAYQRKAAIANFDGICSAHAMVLRANPDIIDPDLFPFFIHSDVFMNRAVDISEGSLSPTIKWKILSEQKFRLPPRLLQKKLADLLFAVDEVEELYRQAYQDFLIFRKSFYKDIFSKIKTKCELGDLPINTIGGLWKSEESDTLQVKIIRSTEFSNFGEMDLSKLEPMSVLRKQFEKSKLLLNDIIIERSGGSPDQPVGRVCLFDLLDSDYSFSNFTSAIRVLDKEVILPKYLFLFLLYYYEIGGTDRIQKQTTGIRNLDYDMYKRIKIPLPTVEEQKIIVEHIEKIEDLRREISNLITKERSIKESLINRIFI